MFIYMCKEDVFGDIEGKFERGVKQPVVYLFIDKKGEVLYIGKTTAFRSRWSQHVRSEKPVVKIDKVVLLLYPSVADAAFSEAQLIAKHRPCWNKHGVNETPSTYEINFVGRVQLKVLTKYLNTFVQKLLTQSTE